MDDSMIERVEKGRVQHDIQGLRPRGDEARERFEDALHDLHQQMKRWDHLEAHAPITPPDTLTR